MRVAAVIAEYNPFHNGHRFHIDAIRRDLGEDTAVVAIMSGSFTQRGEAAVADKWTRAACAIEGGVNLVLELPFPYSLSSAEFFARAGVCIADALGVADTLSFGSECGDLSALSKAAENTSCEEYRKTLSDLLNASPEKGYARAASEAYRRLYGEDSAFVCTPNDILAAEYLRALSVYGGMKPHTVRREGSSYHETDLRPNAYPSATALRLAMKEGVLTEDTMPYGAYALLRRAIDCGSAPCDGERLFPAVLSSFMLNRPFAPDAIHDAKGGLYHRLRRYADEATSLSSWIALSETKKYTRARLRRALWYSFFGVTSSDVSEPPAYTQLLGADDVGLTLLKRIRKTTAIPILTKPSDTDGLTVQARRKKQLADTADKLFLQTMPSPLPPATALRGRPYLKK